MTIQAHLNKVQAVNLGSFYTPHFVVDLAFKMLDSAITNPSDFVLLDSSCGYGSFLRPPKHLQFTKIIGADIDNEALKIAKDSLNFGPKKLVFFHTNSLQNCSRAKFDVAESTPLIIIGNPPYNDKTSIIQNAIKNKAKFEIDSALTHRDLGISFLRSFYQLSADYVCVLHPLSYLIKESNFRSLKQFGANYTLLDSIIISSEVFCKDSKGFFPIIIALYKKDKNGMDYDFIKNYEFKTLENKRFRLNEFDFIKNYVDKYPNKKRVAESSKVAMFYTLRDINALRRSKTFLQKDCTNAVYITQDKFSLYCYIDVFKRFCHQIPYYLGNCDIMIDYARFREIESGFVESSKSGEISPQIKRYFAALLGKHLL